MKTSEISYYFIEWLCTEGVPGLHAPNTLLRQGTNPMFGRLYPMLAPYWQEMEAAGMNLPLLLGNRQANPDDVPGVGGFKGTPFLSMASAAWWLRLMASYFPNEEFQIVEETTIVHTQAVYTPGGRSLSSFPSNGGQALKKSGLRPGR
jgi:hypothetical protein